MSERAYVSGGIGVRVWKNLHCDHKSEDYFAADATHKKTARFGVPRAPCDGVCDHTFFALLRHPDPDGRLSQAVRQGNCPENHTQGVLLVLCRTALHRETAIG